MQLLRSALFHALFYANAIAWFIGGLFLLVLPRPVLMAVARAWTSSCVWIHRVATGSTIEYRGLEHIRPEGMLVAAKHQSSWETLALVSIFPDPCFILKRELLSLPLFGWYLRKARMIAIDRARGSDALAAMSEAARGRIAEQRQILIFPEGTRRPVDAPPAYRYGIARLYEQLGAPCLLVAHNAGLAWPRGSFRVKGARIIVEILPPLPPGLPPEQFFELMQSRIETASARLVAEARGEAGPAA